MGPYVIGSQGLLWGHDIADPAEPVLMTERLFLEKMQKNKFIPNWKNIMLAFLD